MEDIQVLKPTIFCGVPRVYDRIYMGMMLLLDQMPLFSPSCELY